LAHDWGRRQWLRTALLPVARAAPVAGTPRGELGGVVMAAAGGTRAAVSAQAPAPRLDETRSFLNLIGDNQNTVGTKPPI